MKGMILAAGLGTRLGELSTHTPKCLVKIGSKTMLEHIIDRFKSSGIDTVVINLHHLAGTVRSFVKERSSFGITVEFSEEPQILGTGGALKKARSFFEGENSFLVHNGDIYCDLELNKLVQSHNTSGNLATLAVQERKENTYLLFDEKLHLCGFRDSFGVDTFALDTTSPHTCSKPFGFCGIQMVNPSIFQFFPEEDTFSLVKLYMNAAARGSKIGAHLLNDLLWSDMGTPQELEALRKKLT